MSEVGRPTLYQDEYAELAFKLCLAGATNEELARHLGVGSSTIDRWLQKHAEFRDAARRGRDLADGEVAYKLYSRAMGYTWHGERTLVRDGQQITVPHVVHFPPNVHACHIWMRNRRPGNWRPQPPAPPQLGPTFAELEEAEQRYLRMSREDAERRRAEAEGKTGTATP
jgi:transposase-like protein